MLLVCLIITIGRREALPYRPRIGHSGDKLADTRKVKAIVGHSSASDLQENSAEQEGETI